MTKRRIIADNCITVKYICRVNVQGRNNTMQRNEKYKNVKQDLRSGRAALVD